MSYSETDIAYEGDRYWVLDVPGKPGLFEVYQYGPTHSTRCATISFKDDPERAKVKAIEECKRRDELIKQHGA